MTFFFTPGPPSETLNSEKFQKMLILAFAANSALSCQNGLLSLIVYFVNQTFPMIFGHSARRNIWLYYKARLLYTTTTF